MGGPSAALVLTDLAKLGVKAVVRVGTCAALPRAARPGELLVIAQALAEGGSAAAFGVEVGGLVEPDAELRRRLSEELGAEGRAGSVASFDALPASSTGPAEWDAADLQTVAVLGRAAELGIPAAAILVVREQLGGDDAISDGQEQEAARVAGRAAAAVL
jgi:uridine phosphorylase